MLRIQFLILLSIWGHLACAFETVVNLDQYEPTPGQAIAADHKIEALSYSTVQILDRLKQKTPVNLRGDIFEFERQHFISFNPVMKSLTLKCHEPREGEAGSQQMVGDIKIPFPLSSLKGQEVVKVVLEGKDSTLFISKIRLDGEEAFAIFKSHGGVLQDFGFYSPKIEEDDPEVKIAGDVKMNKTPEGQIEKTNVGYKMHVGKQNSSVQTDLVGDAEMKPDQTYKVSGSMERRQKINDHLNYKGKVSGEHQEKLDKARFEQGVEFNLDENNKVYANHMVEKASHNPYLHDSTTVGVEIGDGETTLSASQTRERQKVLTNVSSEVSLSNPALNFTHTKEVEYDEEGRAQTVTTSANGQLIISDEINLNAQGTKVQQVTEDVSSKNGSIGLSYEGEDQSASLTYSRGEDRSYGDVTQTSGVSVEVAPSKVHSVVFTRDQSKNGNQKEVTDAVVYKFTGPEKPSVEVGVGVTRSTENGRSYEGKVKVVDGKHTYELKHLYAINEQKTRGSYTYKFEDISDDPELKENNTLAVTAWVETRRYNGLRTNTGGFLIEALSN